MVIPMKSPFLLFVLLLLLVSLPLIVYAAESDNVSVEIDYLQEGIDLYNDESFEEAVEILMKAVEKRPGSVKGAYYTGLTYKEMRNFVQAQVFLERTLQIDPSFADAQMHLGEVFYNLGQYDDALTSLGKAESLGANTAFTAYLKGLVYLKKNKHRAAIGELNKVETKSRRLEQQTDYYLGLAYYKKGNRSKAKAAFEKAISINPESSTGIMAKKSLDRMETQKSISPYKLSVGYTFQYDDNVLLKPSESIGAVVISEEKDSRSVVTAKGEYAPRQDGKIRYKIGYSFYQSLHQDLDAYDLQGHNLTFTPKFSIGENNLSLPLGYDDFSLDGESYLKMTSFKPSLSIPISESRQLSLSAGVVIKDFVQQQPLADENRDGENWSAGLSYLLFDKKERSFLSLTYRFDKDDTDGRNWEYSGTRFSLYALKPFGNGLKINVLADYYVQQYSNLSSTASVKREDNILTLGAGLGYTFTERVNLKLDYTYIDSDSNVYYYIYERNIVSAGIEFTF